MKTSREENRDNSNAWGINHWLTRLAIVASIGAIVHYGYCFSLWGRKSLLFQHLFQCKCPSFSEEWRFPKEVDVIVSACHQSYVELSPSGRL